MKTVKTLLYALLAMTVVSLQSCYKDDEKLFSESSSARMDAALDEARDMLTSSENGWVFEMYPSETRDYGGFVYTIIFDKEYVTVRSERFPGKVEKSLWKMTNDSGPVLTFDSYNSLIHEFSTPSASAYQAKKGEFEFMVMDVQKDVIKLKGKKTGNIMYMYRLNETAEQYLDKVADINDKFILSGIKGTVDGKEVEGVMDLDYRQIDFTVDGALDVVTVPYSVTSTGIRLYDDFTVGNETLREFNAVFSAEGKTEKIENKAKSISLAAQFPDGWMPYGMFNGDFDLGCLASSSESSYQEKPVTLTPTEDGTGYWLSGINDKYDLKLTYSKALGTISLCTQYLYEKDHKTLTRVEIGGTKYYIGIIPFALPKGASSGSVGYSSEYGLTTSFDSSASDTRFNLVDNGKWAGKKTTCFRLYCFSGTTMGSTTRVTSVNVPADYYIFNTGTTLYYPEKLIKK